MNRSFRFSLMFAGAAIVLAMSVSSSARAAFGDEPEWEWHDARTLLIEGRGWPAVEATYQRLPDRAEADVTPAVRELAKHTAGVCVRFVTDSKRIGATWDGGGAMPHMAATGNSGLDLYRKHGGGWKFCGVGKPNTTQTTATLASNLHGASTEYLLYLPLYNSVTELTIGVEPGATISPASLRETAPIVFYGTSITQGGCASRAGMCHPAILGRWLDRDMINLGFSGAGKMEPALAELLAELDPAIYVLECLPNMTTEMVRERVAPFVRRLREARPNTPILLVESPIHPEQNPGNVALREIRAGLVQAGVAGLHYLRGEELLAGKEDGTVDGVHPTDLGFARMAAAYEPVLREILAETPTTQPGAEARSNGHELPGFERGRHFDEQIKEYTFDPDVSVHINAPAAARFDPAKPTHLVIYALPNGNTTAQTIGKARRPDVDWHFFIQHIGAQTRRLREVDPSENLVVAYVEAGGRSWPTWRRKHENEGGLIARLIDSIKSHFTGELTVDLTAHSGGGSMIFGYINHVEQIPDWFGRIVFLDANYGFSTEQNHGDKLIAWLQSSSRHYLGVVAYDDRRIRVNGKLVVGPTGGTFRKTERMLERLRADLAFDEMSESAYRRWRAMDGRVDLIIVNNPDDKILHTVLVEKNGYIHGLTFGTPLENEAGLFWGPAAYEQWIQPD